MTQQDREFFGLLALVVGPLFIFAGWLSVSSLYGPSLMIAGALQLAAAPILRPTLRILTLAPVLFGVGFGWHDITGAL